jgi:hypothetical protein
MIRTHQVHGCDDLRQRAQSARRAFRTCIER